MGYFSVRVRHTDFRYLADPVADTSWEVTNENDEYNKTLRKETAG